MIPTFDAFCAFAGITNLPPLPPLVLPPISDINAPGPSNAKCDVVDGNAINQFNVDIISDIKFCIFAQSSPIFGNRLPLNCHC
jgi:hypothetical protein